MKESILKRIERGEILLADGAMGTMLMKMGLKSGACAESVNLEDPSILEQIAATYHQAGADLVQTNTFGASALKLAKYGWADRTEQINRIAVEAVRNAIGDNAYVSGSCGPCGQMLQPYGNTTRDEMQRSFSRQVDALIDSGVDVICIETMTDIQESLIAIEAVRNKSESIPLIATMTFDKIPKGYFTIMGIDIPTAAKELSQAGADVVGTNCGNGIQNMIEIARRFKDSTEKPIIVQSNAGLPQLIDNQVKYSETPEFMAKHVETLIDLGVAIIGGCCGTTPEHIQMFRKVLSSKTS